MNDQLFNHAEPETVRGIITRIFWREGTRLIAQITTSSQSRTNAGKRFPSTLSVLGTMADPKEQQEYEFTGTLSFNKQYSRHQLSFEAYHTILPDDRDGIIDYLINVAKWLGPKHAKEVVDAFGDDTLNVLKNDPDRVAAAKIAGLTMDRITEMQESLKRNEKLEAAMVETSTLLAGVVGPITIRKAITKWACDAATKIRTNPFVLMGLPGIGFKVADAVHRKLNGKPGDPIRHDAAVLYSLNESAYGNGHTAIPLNDLDMNVRKLVETFDSGAINRAIEREDVVSVSNEVTDLRYGLADIVEAESYAASKMQAIVDIGEAAEIPPVQVSPKDMATDQAQAVEQFANARVFILTGGPGTGKTWTVARIVEALRASLLTVSLCAPTGKAAKQITLAMQAVGGGQATTIHSLLEAGVDPETEEFAFGRNEHNQLEDDVIVVDETSMVDVNLFHSLLRAVPDTTRLLFVGDSYQLPSVGPGAVLRDMIRAGIPHAELTEIKRNAGRLVLACHAIKDGQTPTPSEKLDLENGENWRHLDVGTPSDVLDMTRTLLTNNIPDLGIDPVWDVQVISPTNEAGALSCKAFNDMLQPILNPNGCDMKGVKGFRTGDKVVRVRNGVVKGWNTTPDSIFEAQPLPNGRINRKLSLGKDQPKPPDSGETRIVNGDIGKIIGLDADKLIVHFPFPDRVVALPKNEHKLKLAYCLTCHKMQGSETPVVILPLHTSMNKSPILNREWLYTAMSRAKRFIITVGQLDTMVPAIAKIGNDARKTTLQDWIQRDRKPRTSNEVADGGETSKPVTLDDITKAADALQHAKDARSPIVNVTELEKGAAEVLKNANLPKPPAGIPNHPGMVAVADPFGMVNDLLELDSGIGENDVKFLDGLFEKLNEDPDLALSERQLAWLNDLWDKHGHRVS